MSGNEKKASVRPRLRLVRPWRWVFLLSFGALTATMAGVALSREAFDGVTILALILVAIWTTVILTLLEVRNPPSEVVRTNVIPPRVLHRTVSGEAVAGFAPSDEGSATTIRRPRG